MKATDIFTPGAVPAYTYYDRADLNLEYRLLEAIETPGMLVSVAGPSKSGKTVLCESVIGRKGLLLIAGGGIHSEDQFWQRLRKKLALPVSKTASTSDDRTLELSGQAKGGVGIPLVAKGEVLVGGKVASTSKVGESATYDGPDGVELLEHLRDQEKTLVVDDFHYVARDVQRNLAQQFKEAARAQCGIVLVSVTTRADDVIRANPDLRGRVMSLDIPYWRREELARIAEAGFPLLNLAVANSVVARLTLESLSSPQLMQALCLQLCREMGVDYAQDTVLPLTLTMPQQEGLLRAATMFANCKTALDILLTGPKPRGQERWVYLFQNCEEGDIYHTVLKAIAADPPVLELPYATLKDRVERIVVGDSPPGSSIVSTLEQMDKAVRERLGEDRVLDWDVEKTTLNLPDPYFLYFLRWHTW